MKEIVQPFPLMFEKKHRACIGETQSGKTWYILNKQFFAPRHRLWTKYTKVSYLPGRQIFFDTNLSTIKPDYEKQINKWGSVYPKQILVTHNIDLFLQAWNLGVKWIIFRPGLNESTRSFRNRVEFITDAVRSAQIQIKPKFWEDVYFYFDECSSISYKHKENAVTEIATKGAGLRLFGIYISQRPAQMNRNIFDECKYKIFFDLATETWKAIHNTYAIKSPDDVKEFLHKNKYSHVVYDGHDYKKVKA